MDEPAENLQVVRQGAAVLDTLEIRYALGGSMASSIFGIPRFTQDSDITVESFPDRESQFAACFGPEYYISLAAIVEANARHSSFNIIHTHFGFKVDIFVRIDRPFDRPALDRRIKLRLPDAPDRPVAILSPEDIILFKLERYRQGGEISDRQWSDVLGVMQVQAPNLDNSYLDRWASQLKVTDLLNQARTEAESD
jgi:hypothetical protein